MTHGLQQADWNHVRAFVAAADHGSLTAAAAALGVAQPTVGRQVAALEQALAVVLFERVGRGLRLTEAGELLLEPARGMAQAAERLSLLATRQSEALNGRVRVTASELICAYLLPPVVAKLRSEYPGIEVDLVADNKLTNLLEREADIAVRNVAPTHPDLVATKLRQAWAGLYASREYAAGLRTPEDPQSYGEASFLGVDRGPRMLGYLQQLGLPLTQANFPVVTGNHLVLWAMAREGLGISAVMEEVGDADASMVRLLPELKFPVPMWLVCHRELRTSRRLRVVFDLMAEVLRTPVG